MLSIKEIVEGIRTRAAANPGKTAGIHAVYQFHLSGDGGGSFYAAIQDGAADVTEGDHPSPQVTVTISAADFHSLVTGQLNPVSAFMSGRLKVSGDMGLAMKLQQFLS